MNVDFEDAPKVTLGGQDWPIPMLAAKQNRIIDPLILSLIPLFSTLQTDRVAGMGMLGTKEYDAFTEIAYQATKRARPEFTREQFLDLPIALPELIAAFPVLAQQTGIFKRGEPGEPKAGAAPANPPTGMESSPTSAI